MTVAETCACLVMRGACLAGGVRRQEEDEEERERETKTQGESEGEGGESYLGDQPRVACTL